MRPEPIGGAMRAPLPDHFSYSSMSTFQTCPRKWRYVYLLRAEREFQEGALLLGQGLHAALEAMHRALLTGAAMDPARAFDIYAQHWALAPDLPLRFNRGEDRARCDAWARAFLELYSQSEVPRLTSIVGIEESVRVRVDSLAVPVVGRLDLLVEEASGWVLVDAKTSKAVYGEEKLREATSQLALYAAGLAPGLATQDRPLRGRFLVFRKLAVPRLERIEVVLDPNTLGRTALLFRETWRLIEAAHAVDSFPARPGWPCRLCPYQARCARETGTAPSAGAVV